MSISQGSILSFFICLLSGAVRRCEIVGGASRFLVAAHPSNWVWCVAVRLLVVLPDFWWRRTLRMMLYGRTDSHDLIICQGREKVKQNCGSIAQNFCSNSIYRSRVYLSFKSPWP